MNWRQGFEHTRIIDVNNWLIQSIGACLITSILLPASLGGQAWAWASVVAASQILIGAWLWLCKIAFVGDKSIAERPFVAVLIYLASGLIVNFFVTSVSTFFNISDPNSASESRLPAVAVSFACWSFVIALARGEFTRTKNLLAKISRQLEIENDLGTTSLIKLEEYRAKVAYEIQSTLNSAFEKLPKMQLAKNEGSNTRAKALHELIDEVVKPLGRKLALREPDEVQIQFGYANSQPRKRNARQILQLVPAVSPFNPLATLLLTVAVGFLGKSRIEGFSTVLVLVAMSGSVVFLASIAAKRLQRWLQPKLSEGAWIAIFLLLTCAIAIADAMTTVMYFGWGKGSTALLFGLSSVGLILQVAVAGVIGLQQDRTTTLANLDSAVKRVAWMNARLTQLTWVEKRRLAKLVHGDIQARIMATALSIDINRVDEAKAQQLIEALRADCDTALFQPIQQSSLPDFIAALTKIWRASVQIDCEISGEALHVLESDAAAADSVAEIIREGVNNAVRHGGANKIWIDAKLQDFDISGDILDVGLLHLAIRDNGRGVSGNIAEPGLGTELLNQLTLSWSLTKNENITLLRADVPLRAAAQTELIG